MQFPDRSPSSSSSEFDTLPHRSEALPSLKDLNLEPFSRRNNTPYTHRRRHSVGYPLTHEDLSVEDEDEDEEYEPAPDSPILWRRTSLDQGLSRLRNAPKIKEDTEMEYLPEKRMRKRSSISEDIDVGDDSDSEEEERPKKAKLRKYCKGRRGRGKVFQCSGRDSCSLCKTGPPHYLQKSMNPGWRETLLAVFENFEKRVTYREWMSRKKGNGATFEEDIINKEHVADIDWLYLPDSYGFLEYHWDIICPPQHKNRSFTGNNWRKTLQDTLSHNRTYFISGKELFGKTGFWRLADSVTIANTHDKNFLENYKPTNMTPSMFTIDAILKRAEAQGQIPNFSSPSPSQHDSSPEVSSSVTSSPQAEMSELELLVSAIEKMHSACS